MKIYEVKKSITGLLDHKCVSSEFLFTDFAEAKSVFAKEVSERRAALDNISFSEESPCQNEVKFSYWDGKRCLTYHFGIYEKEVFVGTEFREKAYNEAKAFFEKANKNVREAKETTSESEPDTYPLPFGVGTVKGKIIEVNRSTASKLIQYGLKVHHPANTESFYIYREEWEASTLFRDIILKRWEPEAQKRREKAFVNFPGDVVAIYAERVPCKIMMHENYDLIQTMKAYIPAGTDTETYVKEIIALNIRHMEPSAVIAVKRNGKIRCFYLIDKSMDTPKYAEIVLNWF